MAQVPIAGECRATRTWLYDLRKSNVHVNEDSKSDMEEVYDESTHFMASKGMKERSGIGNKSLYEQWKETMSDDEYDPYDDDDYNTHGLFEEKEAFCDALDIKFCS